MCWDIISAKYMFKLKQYAKAHNGVKAEFINKKRNAHRRKREARDKSNLKVLTIETSIILLVNALSLKRYCFVSNYIFCFKVKFLFQWCQKWTDIIGCKSSGYEGILNIHIREKYQRYIYVSVFYITISAY